MPYCLFLLVTATLFVRPQEITSAVQGWNIYEYLIIACMVLSWPRVMRQLTTQSLMENPITTCVLGMWLAVVLSHLSHLFLGGAWTSGFMFFKVVVYYLLLVGVLDSVPRLQSFLRWLFLFILAIAALPLLNAYGIIDIPAVQAMQEQRADPTTGELGFVSRLRSTGIFHDPNDLAMILSVGVAIGLGFFLGSNSWLLRIFSLTSVAVLVYASYLTQSRGGLLALLATLGTILYFRWGGKRALLSALFLFALLLVAPQGRMTSFDEGLSRGTGKGRILGWAEGLALFREEPVFGVGYDTYGERLGLAAHNSFVHCFTELGFLGGTFFLGAFAAALVMLYRLHRENAFAEHAGIKAVLPTITAALAGYCVAMLSLSRTYVTPTYLVLGLATAYVRVAVEPPLTPPLRFDSRFVNRIALGSVCFLLATYVLIRVTARGS